MRPLLSPVFSSLFDIIGVSQQQQRRRQNPPFSMKKAMITSYFLGKEKKILPPPLRDGCDGGGEFHSPHSYVPSPTQPNQGERPSRWRKTVKPGRICPPFGFTIAPAQYRTQNFVQLAYLINQLQVEQFLAQT